MQERIICRPELRFVWILPLLFAVAAGQSTSCPTDPSCDTQSSPCLGYGDLSIKCPNGTSIRFGACYTSDFCPAVAADQGNDWIRITVNNINPKQCYAYSNSIRQSLLGAYNSWCCQDDNYLKCCPGSTGWPTGVARSPANCIAMQNYATEIQYVGAAGSALQTQFFLKLSPRVDSPLCQLLVYPSGSSGGSATNSSSGAAASATTTATATAASTVSTNANTTATPTTTTAAATPATTSRSTAPAATTTTTAAAAAATTTTTAAAAAATTTTTAAAAAATTTTTAAAAAATTTTTAAASNATTTRSTAAAATNTSTTTRASSTTVSAASGTATTRAVRRRRRDLDGEESAELRPDDDSVDNWPVEDAAESPSKLRDEQRSRSRRAVTSVTVTLNADTVRLIVTSVNVPSLVISAVTTASNYTISVTVTVEQVAAPAATLSPDRQSSSWVIATGVLCGLLAATVVVYLIACTVYKSQNKGNGLPL